MEWAQTAAIIGTLGTGMAFLWKEMRNIEKEIREDTRLNTKRSDRLYEMFIELLRDKKK